ncbi:glycosyl hydrolase [Sorangium sp. So ce429]
MKKSGVSRYLAGSAAIALLAALLCPANDAASAAPRDSKVLKFLYSISGSKTIAGQHNREPNADPARWTRKIQQITGKHPLLWGGDFLFDADSIKHRGTMIGEAKRQWARGALVTLTWHACPPTVSEPCDWHRDILSHLRDDQWNEIIRNGSNLNVRWKARLDTIVPYLRDLMNNDVEVLFRPLHEMNDGWSWWGGRPGDNGSRALYRITHDYLVNTKGLHNLIWVWNVKDVKIQSIQEYYPGDKYLDVASLDIYVNGYTQENYRAMLNIARGKPIAVGECQDLPSPSVLASQPRWVWFLGWAELVVQRSSPAQLRAIYNDPRVLTLGAFPTSRH